MERAFMPIAPMRDSLMPTFHRVDVASGNRENLTPHQGQILYVGSSLSADGRTLLVTSSEKAGFNSVAMLDVASKKLTGVTDTGWDASAGSFAPQGGKYTFIINEDGRTDTYLADLDGGQPEKISFPAGLTFFSGNPTPFSPSDDRLLVSHQSSQRPSDLWAYDLDPNPKVRSCLIQDSQSILM